jgi:cell division protease FtsH
MTRARPAPEAVPPKKSVPRAPRSGSKVRPDPNPRLAAKAPEDSAGPFERAQREAETIRWAALRRRFRNGALGTAAAHGFRSAENEREFSIDIGSYDDDRSGRKRGGAGRGPRIVGDHDVAARLMLAAAIDGCEGLAGELRSGAPVVAFDVADRRRSSPSTSPIVSSSRPSKSAGPT